MPTVWVSNEETALNQATLDDLEIAVLVRCVGKAQAHIKGIHQVDATVFSSTWGGGPYDSLADVHAVIYNTMSEVILRRSMTQVKAETTPDYVFFTCGNMSTSLTSGGPQRPSGWNATRQT
jgi:hypothetical protein